MVIKRERNCHQGIIKNMRSIQNREDLYKHQEIHVNIGRSLDVIVGRTLDV